MTCSSSFYYSLLYSSTIIVHSRQDVCARVSRKRLGLSTLSRRGARRRCGCEMGTRARFVIFCRQNTNLWTQRSLLGRWYISDLARATTRPTEWRLARMTCPRTWYSCAKPTQPWVRLRRSPGRITRLNLLCSSCLFSLLHRILGLHEKMNHQDILKLEKLRIPKFRQLIRSGKAPLFFVYFYRDSRQACSMIASPDCSICTFTRLPSNGSC